MSEGYGSMEGVSGIAKMLINHAVLFLLTSLFIFAGLVYIIATISPRYSAETMLLLPSTPTTSLAEKATAPSTPQTDPYLIKSYIDIAKNDGLSRNVIRKLHLVDNPEYAVRPGLLYPLFAYLERWLPTRPPSAHKASDIAEERVLRIYQKRLKAFNDGHSLTLVLSYEDEDPALAARVVNAQAEAYIQSQTGYRSQEANVKTDWLKSQLDEASKAVRAAQVAIQMHLITASNKIEAADNAAELKSRQSIAAAKQSVYESLLSRYMIMVAERQYVGSDTRVVSPAIVSTIPKSPNIPVFVALAALVSLLFGAALSLAYAYFSAAVDLGDLATSAGVRALGTLRIPRFVDGFGFAKSVRLRRACFWEQIRMIRSALRGPQENGVVIAFASTMPGAGTSLVAASLARVAASSGSRTLLIDLDIRRPRAQVLLEVDRHERFGLFEVLSGAIRIEDALISAGYNESLFFLGSAHNGIKNIDTLSGARMKALIQYARSIFDLVILDTPPFDIVSDALNVVGTADSTILVTQASEIRSGNLRKAAVLLRERSVPLGGFILTNHAKAPLSLIYRLKAYMINDPLIDVRPIPRKRWFWAPEGGSQTASFLGPVSDNVA